MSIRNLMESVSERYLPVDTLGNGAFSTVFKAIHRQSRHPVAVKVIDKSAGVDAARLHREFEALKAVSHPNIVALYESFEDEKKLVFVLEFVGHGSLRQRIEATGRIDECRAKRWFVQLIRVVDHLHNAIGLVHRDLKCDNILIDDNESIKLADFGLCNFIPDQNSMLVTRCGTPTHVAPEVVKGEGYGPKADIWSLGVMLYHMLTGQLPFVDTSVMAVIRKVVVSEPEYPPVISTLARDLISRLLAKNPSERLSLEEIKSHPWLSEYFKGEEASNELPLSEVVKMIVPRCDMTEEEILAGFKEGVFDAKMALPRILANSVRKPMGITKDGAVRSMTRMDRFMRREGGENIRFSKMAIGVSRTHDVRRRRSIVKMTQDSVMFRFHVPVQRGIQQVQSCPTALFGDV